MAAIPPDVEAQLAKMTDAEWSALTAKVRAPDSTEALRTAAAELLSGSALDSFVSYADVSKFVDDSGAVDQQKVRGHLTAALGLPATNADHGRGSGTVPGRRAGDAGKEAAAKRFGTPKPETPGSDTTFGSGAGGRAEAQRRFGTKGEHQ